MLPFWPSAQKQPTPTLLTHEQDESAAEASAHHHHAAFTHSVSAGHHQSCGIRATPSRWSSLNIGTS